MKEKRKLGKGLDAIFGANLEAALNDIKKIDENGIVSSNQEINIKEIRTNPYQPRKTFDREKLQELADSIKIHGVFQPILVRKSIKGYELISGERRTRASKLAGKEMIPAIVLEFNDEQMMEVSLLENIQREDLSIIEEAKAYQNLIEKIGYTQEELAKRVGKSREHITNTLRLLKLPATILGYLNEKKISAGSARSLLSLDDQQQMIEVAKLAIEQSMSVRTLEKYIKNLKSGIKPKKVKEMNHNLKYVKELCERKLNTKVDITSRKLTIFYKGNQQLNSILELLGAIEE